MLSFYTKSVQLSFAAAFRADVADAEADPHFHIRCEFVPTFPVTLHSAIKSGKELCVSPSACLLAAG
jgi:hypothetical protein